MVFGPIVPLKSLYITRLAHYLYQKLPTYFSDEAPRKRFGQNFLHDPGVMPVAQYYMISLICCWLIAHKVNQTNEMHYMQVRHVLLFHENV